MCQFFVVLTLGVLEPLILVVPALLVRAPLQASIAASAWRAKDGGAAARAEARAGSRGILRAAVLAAAPGALAQGLVVFLPPAVGRPASSANEALFLSWGCEGLG